MNKNIAYIDGTNLYKGIKSLEKELDYFRFRKWLIHKYRINEAFIFMGYIQKQEFLYQYLKNAGFKLIFKESVTQKCETKGNADAEMILQCVRDYLEKMPNNIVLVSGDGDFSCLIDFLVEKKKFKTILIPSRKYCSYLLRKKKCSLTFLDNERLLPNIIKRERTPGRY